MRIINSAFWVELNVTLKILVFYILSLQSSWHFTFWTVCGSSGRQRNQQRYSCWCLHHVLCRANSNGVLFSRRRPVDNGGHRPADRASGLVLLEQLGYASSVAPVAAARNDEAPLSPTIDWRTAVAGLAGFSIDMSPILLILLGVWVVQRTLIYIWRPQLPTVLGKGNYG